MKLLAVLLLILLVASSAPACSPATLAAARRAYGANARSGYRWGQEFIFDRRGNVVAWVWRDGYGGERVVAMNATIRP